MNNIKVLLLNIKTNTTNHMKTYKAISTEKNDKSFGQVISTTKVGVNKGLSKGEFIGALPTQTWVSFIVEEM